MNSNNKHLLLLTPIILIMNMVILFIFPEQGSKAKLFEQTILTVSSVLTIGLLFLNFKINCSNRLKELALTAVLTFSLAFVSFFKLLISKGSIELQIFPILCIMVLSVVINPHHIFPAILFSMLSASMIALAEFPDSVNLSDAHPGMFAVIAISLFVGFYKKEATRKAIEEAQKAKILGKAIAHELRTPLSTIQNLTLGISSNLPALIKGYELAKANDLLIEHQLIPAHQIETISRTISQINSSATNAQQVIDMLLVKLMAKKNQYNQTFSIKSCIEEAISELSINTQRIEIISRLDPDFLVKSHYTALKHVFINLIKNAHFQIERHKKGSITIETTQNAKENIVIVKDTAIGLSSQVLPYIFDMNYNNEKEGISGGMGLAFCKFTLENSLGSIDCNSKYGEFTEFSLKFPKIG